ncbi:M14-type cytosolic carboxypeptidase [Shewanella sp. JNE10-2]|uniref:M14 family metallopeptidase n=1 Tax=unclassified Shewanella TaxID=196818 RepID=UPI0020049F49|nr:MULTISPECIES: M14-type cytosolic carboxypeptidase [unclassified Shewanella]MCK7631989.1 M14-type cytosolic carboxypeptidase [Shewanella sp. JNE9-1]MCK7647175.1 M14-type cytosolic carboxypeptidase [Shewanella sp. JNE3-1]MCK7655287.1 M14-type cytosolic carboxypeptidase [Shewanella sp. JNE4-1]UPO26222.1 M14-type cytosolic carboxypeptidase [Shewanella sp. JNE10-2]UPO37208.1 M14-type cytosolic carboxypeptidase [Shewanella sp. JNE7]
MRISANFDGGNIQVVNLDNKDDIQLAIRPDAGGEFYQWFNFRFEGSVGHQYTLNIINAGTASYPKGWENYQAVASYDRQHWFRVPTQYQDGTLTIQLELDCDAIQIAYFAPYSYERHLDLLSSAQLHPDVNLEHLGLTLDGRDITLVKVGNDHPSKRNIWITARQHPGETMAEWLVEGLINRLLDNDCPTAKSLLDKANFYIVPNMNPDGSVRGHLRTNAVGVNLNREWQSPSLEKSPEVYHVVNKMKKIGVDLFYDVHGDEGLPYVFLAGCEGVPTYSDRLAQLQADFSQALTLASADFQTQFGYAKDEPGQANLTVASNWVAQTFECLSNTLEMPFKDNNNLPDPFVGWSPERSLYLGEASLIAMLAVVDKLR